MTHHYAHRHFQPQVHFFVATGGTGKQIYGTCLTIWEQRTLHSKKDGKEEQQKAYLPKCLVILSTYPYLAAFREFLTQLYRLVKSGTMTLPIERYIVNFCAEMPAPPPGSFEVQTTILDSVIKIWSPPYNLPIAWVSIPFTFLFECLDLDNIILVWHCLVLERQVLITSTQLSVLTQATEIFLSLLFPMRWSHAYIPVLPTFLIPMLSAPMPFLCGINKANLADALYDLSRECVLVDLDKNTVTLGPDTPDLPPLPPYQEAQLNAQLEENAGMIFREARSLTKSDDLSDNGTHLPSHVKMMAEAMWESKLCLFDEAFHLVFTPEEARKNHLNGNDASGMEMADKDITHPLGKSERTTVGRKQSNWDAVQEAFLDTFVYLLRNYRKYLVFPSKHNEGSYGGAGFRSKEFIEAQRYDMREFLEEFIGTQMFDNFITKRLYGSGEADVAFFDNAVDRFLKTAGIFADVGLSGRFLTSSKDKGGKGPAHQRRPSKAKVKVAPKANEDPLLQSAKVHRALKTIVPPEPTGEGLTPPPLEQVITSTSIEDDTSVKSATSSVTRNSTTSATSARMTRGGSTVSNKDNVPVYTYTDFPTKWNEALFGEPRPLSAAVIAEFDRQRKDAAQFRRRDRPPRSTQNHIRKASSADATIPPSPEASTFTLFFMAFTALVGKEMMEIAHEEAADDKLILSTYVPTGNYESDTETGVHEEDDTTMDESEKADLAEMKSVRPNLGGMFGDDDLDSEHDSRRPDSKQLEDVEITETSAEDSAREKEEPKVVEKKVEKPQHDETVQDDASTSTTKTDQTDENQPRRRFRDKLSDLQIEEAKAKGRAQLGLAFEMLTMMKKRGLRADPEAYQCLIDACGRVGDTKRATELLGKMHEDGIVADGTVYACLVSAFSADSAWKDSQQDEDLPEWANSTAVEMDWNKLQKRSIFDRLVGQAIEDESDEEENSENLSAYQKLRRAMLKKTSSKDGSTTAKEDSKQRVEFFVTEQVEQQTTLGENLLEIVCPDISIDTENEYCPRCNFLLSDDHVVEGWTPGDHNDYTTACPNCTQRFVPHFCVQSSSPTFMGSKGPASPLLCERLSPWVLIKEIRSVMSDVEGIDNLLNPKWREKESKNAVLWWNLVLSCMRYRFPFTFLLQGHFAQNLIAPMPEDEA